MAYTAHTWITGETITADLLNALEQEVASLSTVVETLKLRQSRARARRPSRLARH